MDSEAGKLVGQLNAARKQLSGVPDAMLSAEQRTAGKEMAAGVDDLIAAITCLHKKSKIYAEFGDAMLDTVKKLRREDSRAPRWPRVPDRMRSGSTALPTSCSSARSMATH